MNWIPSDISSLLARVIVRSVDSGNALKIASNLRVDAEHCSRGVAKFLRNIAILIELDIKARSGE